MIIFYRGGLEVDQKQIHHPVIHHQKSDDEEDLFLIHRYAIDSTYFVLYVIVISYLRQNSLAANGVCLFKLILFSRYLSLLIYDIFHVNGVYDSTNEIYPSPWEFYDNLYLGIYRQVSISYVYS